MEMSVMLKRTMGYLALMVGLTAGQTALADPVIEDITFSSQPGGKFEIRLDFNEPPPVDLDAYTIEKPARIAIDFPATQSALAQKRYPLSFGNATGVLVLESGDRTRMVVNLVKLVPYETSVRGNQLILQVGQDSSGSYAQTSTADGVLETQMNRVAKVESEITDLQFRRSEEGEGRLVLTLSNAAVDVNVFSEGSRIALEFLDTAVPESLLRNFDVTDFATPVTSVEVNTTERGTRLQLAATGYFDYLAYQTGNEYILSVKPLTEKEKEELESEFSYVGDRISLNFQDIEVRAVLQLIADFTELNLVASDTVEGNITLRLQSVPWDQALELVLKTRGLDSRQIGNVLMVAPAEEIAERERQQVEANKTIAELAPLQNEFIRIRYASAEDIVELLKGDAELTESEGASRSMVSARGSIKFDKRTNSIIITDTAANLAAVRDLIEKVDIPIRQVMIEARIVIADSDLNNSLGVRWGGGYLNRGSDSITSVARGLDDVATLNTQAIAGAGLSYPANPLVDLGIEEGGKSGFAIGFTSKDLFLTAELQALEASGQGEIVSQPKVITGDKLPATIKSGTEIPYQEGAASGATTTQFKEAVLKLEVTPNITPDGRILLDLVINQDSVGEEVGTPNGGRIPSIDTTELTTQVLVGNGETVVLGGVFQSDERIDVSKVPVLGDIPYLGNLFKSTIKQSIKQETLIFITPRILSDALLD